MNTNHETILDVAGMHCGSCVRRVSNALGQLAGVAKVEVRLKDGKVLVHHDATRTAVEDLVGALDRAGYVAGLAAAA